MPKSLHDRAGSGLHDIRMAETRKEVEAAFGLFVETCGVNCERAVEKLASDRDELLRFCGFPCVHWKHVRTANPVESVFSTVGNRTRKTRGWLSRKTALIMLFKLMMSAKGKWRRISGPSRLPKVIEEIEFWDGIKQVQAAA